MDSNNQGDLTPASLVEHDEPNGVQGSAGAMKEGDNNGNTQSQSKMPDA